MGKIINKVTDTLGLTDSQQGARTTQTGYGQMAEAQKEALEYLKEVDALPRQYRETAMAKFADIFGMGEDPDSRGAFFEGLKEDPFYQQIMGTMEGRQEDYARTQGATGNLRGGETIRGIGDIRQETEAEALKTAYGNQLAGIQAMMGIPTYEKDIYSGMIGIGETEGMGTVRTGQAQAQSEQAAFENALGIADLFI